MCFWTSQYAKIKGINRLITNPIEIVVRGLMMPHAQGIVCLILRGILAIFSPRRRSFGRTRDIYPIEFSLVTPNPCCNPDKPKWPMDIALQVSPGEIHSLITGPLWTSLCFVHCYFLPF